MIELKAISSESIGAALEKAERYRLLNEPREAESICLDILAVDPDHRQALITLLLSLSDQFDTRLGGPFEEARELLPRIDGEYERKYYEGVILERWGKSHLNSQMSMDSVSEWLRAAMRCYDEAEPHRPPGNDDAILRWNACARLIQRASPERPPGSHAKPVDPHDFFDDEVPLR